MVKTKWINLYNSAIEHIKNKELYSACRKLEDAVIESDDVRPFNLLGLCYLRIGKLSISKQCFDKSLTISSFDNDANYYQKKLGEAIESFEEMYKKLQFLYKNELYNEALDFIEKNLKLYINDTQYYFDIIGILNWKLKKHNEAIEFWKKSLDVNIENQAACRYIIDVMSEKKSSFWLFGFFSNLKSIFRKKD